MFKLWIMLLYISLCAIISRKFNQLHLFYMYSIFCRNIYSGRSGYISDTADNFPWWMQLWSGTPHKHCVPDIYADASHSSEILLINKLEKNLNIEMPFKKKCASFVCTGKSPWRAKWRDFDDSLKSWLALRGQELEAQRHSYLCLVVQQFYTTLWNLNMIFSW